MKRATVWRSFVRQALVLFLLLVITGALFYEIRSIFAIRSIKVVGEGVSIVIDEKRLPKNLLFFPADQVREEILRENPMVRSVTIRKNFPSSLSVVLDARRPFALVESEGEWYVVDDEGVILERGRRDALSIIHARLGPMQPGMRVGDPVVVRSLALLGATKHIIPVQEFSFSQFQAIEARAGSMRIFYPQSGDILTLADTLQTIIVGFKIKGTVPGTIDLRFDKPIITF